MSAGPDDVRIELERISADVGGELRRPKVKLPAVPDAVEEEGIGLAESGGESSV
ncbi:hypothetical protein ACWC9T_33510 [Kitasatospora sp. NPDC001159]